MVRTRFESITIEQLRALPARQTHVITVNNRLAREIVKYFKPQRSQVRDLPSIYPLSAWLTQQLFNAGLHLITPGQERSALGLPHLIDSFTSQMLWAQVIAEHESQNPLLDVNRAAQQASSAHGLLLTWRIKVHASEATPEYQRFMLWRQTYLDRLNTQSAIDGYQRLDAVNTYAAQGVLSLPDSVVLSGFKDRAPSEVDLLETLAKQGVTIYELLIPQEPTQSVRTLSCLDQYEEWQQAARWARDQLGANPAGRFAIIAPNLQEQADHAKRVLTRELSHAFNVAVAPPLAQWPLAQAMLAWLEVINRFEAGQRCDVHVVSKPLLLGFCAGHAQEASERALLDAQWRRFEQMYVTLGDWLSSLDRLPQLRQAWLTLQAGQFTHPVRTQSAYQWTLIWRNQLAAIGFPGDQTLDSIDYQVVMAIDALFETFMALDQVLEPMSVQQALGFLGRLARQMPFQPQRDPTARLDVLGLLEAEGGRWDAVWVMGLNDDVLPASPNPNPFIPLSALIAAQAPRATPERERLWASQLFEDLMQCAPVVTLSWSQQAGERELRPAPLLMSYPAQGFDAGPMDQSPSPSQMTTSDASVPIQIWHDTHTPTVTIDERIKGGADLFETQARNPLWAFFRYRLNVRALKPYALTRPVVEQGLFMHGVMKALVQTYPSQQQLLEACQAPDWDTILDHLIEQVAQAQLTLMPKQLQAMHCARAKQVVNVWCEFDAKRAPYVMKHVEEKLMLAHGPLNITLQVDRIDELQAGHYVVFDYKTGTVPSDLKKEWSRPNPIASQLLTYTLAWQQHEPSAHIAAMALLQIKPNQTQAVGFSEVNIGIESLKPLDASTGFLSNEHLEQVDEQALWHMTLAHLQGNVLRVADRFIEGDAANHSWSLDDLKYCDIKPLLRLHEVDADE